MDDAGLLDGEPLEEPEMLELEITVEGQSSLMPLFVLWTDHQGTVSAAVLAHKYRRVSQGRRERKDYKVLRGPQGPRGPRGLRGPQGRRDHKDYKVLQGSQGLQGPLVHKDCRVLLGRREHKGCRASQVQCDHRDCRALQGQRGQRVLQLHRLPRQIMP